MQEFARWYKSDCYTALHKQIILDYCADRCSLVKAEMALLVLVGGKEGFDKLTSTSSTSSPSLSSGSKVGDGKTRVRITCSLKTGFSNTSDPPASHHHESAPSASSTIFFDMASLHHQTTAEDFFMTESELILPDLLNWAASVSSFRNWFKNWYQIAEDATLQLKSYSHDQLLETVDLLCKPSSAHSGLFSFSKNAVISNPLKADILFAKAALVEKNVALCQELYSNPLIASLGERNSLFHIAMDSEVPEIMQLFLKGSPRMTLAYHIFKSSDELNIPLLINSGKYDIEAADNLALEMACRKKFPNVIQILALKCLCLDDVFSVEIWNCLKYSSLIRAVDSIQQLETSNFLDLPLNTCQFWRPCCKILAVPGWY